MATALGAPGDAGEIAARAGLGAPQARVPIDWMLRFLAARGWIAEVSGGARRRYWSRGELPALDASPVRQEQQRWDPSWMPAYALAEAVARDYPAVPARRGGGRGRAVRPAPAPALGRLLLERQWPLRRQQSRRRRRRRGLAARARQLDSRAGRRASRSGALARARGARGAGPSSATSGATASPSPCRHSCAGESRRCAIGTRRSTA